MELFQTRLAVLRASSLRLADLVTGFGDGDLTRQSYATEWSFADVLSHLGSGAVIGRRILEDTLAGATTPNDFPPSVWAEWDAKSPHQKADDALPADRAFVARLSALTAAERASLRVRMGPMELDAASYVGIRLNEHALHTWDIAVMLDGNATLPSDAAAACVDNLEIVGQFVGRPTGAEQTITVATTDPARRFTVTMTKESVTLAPIAAGDAEAGEAATDASDADVTVPAEAFVRLVYGRLEVDAPAILVELRKAYPGF